MKLFMTFTSPFARKVRVVAHERGLDSSLELIDGHPLNEPPALLQANPLLKVPALQLDNGDVLYDSKIICEYLDSLPGDSKLIPDGKDRLEMFNVVAIADGLTDAAVALVIERVRPEEYQYDPFINRQRQRVINSLPLLEKKLFSLPDYSSTGDINLAHIATACAINFIQFRTPETTALAEEYVSDRLKKWVAEFNQRESMQLTSPPTA